MAKRHRKTPKPPKNSQQLVVYNPRATSVSNEVYSSELRKILQKYIDGVVKPFRKEWREIVRTNEFTPALNSSKEKQEKSIEISKKTISFEFLRDIEELRRFSGINEMFSKLDKWEIKGVKRKMKDVCDAYFSHESLGTKKLRSVNEVVNHLLPEGYPKLHTKKGKKKVKEVPRKRKSRFFLGSSSSQKNEENSTIPRDAESMQIVIPFEEGISMEDMLNDSTANDNWIVAVAEGVEMDEEFPKYKDLENEFFHRCS
ncbi:hypothetical protein P8452_30328 [Trifolium repens]|nr:hypothetical protein P8452_30328 [Trifolium repens]